MDQSGNYSYYVFLMSIPVTGSQKSSILSATWSCLILQRALMTHLQLARGCRVRTYRSTALRHSESVECWLLISTLVLSGTHNQPPIAYHLLSILPRAFNTFSTVRAGTTMERDNNNSLLLDSTVCVK